MNPVGVVLFATVGDATGNVTATDFDERDLPTPRRTRGAKVNGALVETMDSEL